MASSQSIGQAVSFPSPSARQLRKQANPAVDLRKVEAARKLIGLFGAGAAGGVAARSLFGLRDMLQPAPQPAKPSTFLPQPLRLYSPARLAGEVAPQEKQAAGSDAIQKVLTAVGPAAQRAGDFVQSIPDLAARGLAKVLPSPRATNVLADQFYMPAGVAAAGAGLYGGSKLTDWLLNRERESENAAELGDAESDYRQALADQYRAIMRAKRGSAEDLGLQQLADQQLSGRQEKQAIGLSMPYLFGGDTADGVFANHWPLGFAGVGNDWWEKAKGLGNTATMLTTLGAGKLTYDWARNANKRELLEKALKRRQVLRQSASPPPLVAFTDDANESNK